MKRDRTRRRKRVKAIHAEIERCERKKDKTLNLSADPEKGVESGIAKSSADDA